MAEQQGAGTEQATAGQLAIQRIYVKDISFESPNTPEVFREKWEPQVNMELSNEHQRLDDHLYDVTLSITISVADEDKTIYLTEVKQSGIFLIEGFPEDAMHRILAAACPNILFPFARELVADIVTRGGFPQLLLSPVNFDALYLQQQQQAAAESDTKH